MSNETVTGTVTQPTPAPKPIAPEPPPTSSAAANRFKDLQSAYNRHGVIDPEILLGLLKALAGG